MNTKKFMVSFLVFILLSVIAESNIAASQWILAASDNDKEVFVDMRSLRKNGRDVKVRENWVDVMPQETKGTYPRETYYFSSQKLFKYHCDEGTAHLLEFTLYAHYQDGSSTVADYFEYPETPSYKIEMIPHTLAARVLEFVCSVKKTSKNR